MKIQLLKKTSSKSFKMLAGVNRPIVPSHVSRLAESISKLGILRPIIVAKIAFITGKLETYIIDGQHTFSALIRNNMDIPYLVLDKPIKNIGELIEIIALLNASSKSWSMLDYVTAWSHVHDDFKKLNRYYEVYDLELTDLADILSGGNGQRNGGGRTSGPIKTGKFRVSNEDQQVEVLDCLTDVLKLFPRVSRYESKYLTSEYIYFLRNEPRYNHKRFLANLKTHKNLFHLATQEEGKLSTMFKKLVK